MVAHAEASSAHEMFSHSEVDVAPVVVVVHVWSSVHVAKTASPSAQGAVVVVSVQNPDVA